MLFRVNGGRTPFETGAAPGAVTGAGWGSILGDEGDLLPREGFSRCGDDTEGFSSASGRVAGMGGGGDNEEFEADVNGRLFVSLTIRLPFSSLPLSGSERSDRIRM